MPTLRASYRLLVIALATPTGVAAVLVLRLLKPVAPALYISLRNRVFSFWGRFFCKLIGLNVTLRGTPPT